jgi:hypothetical protein
MFNLLSYLSSRYFLLFLKYLHYMIIKKLILVYMKVSFATVLCFLQLTVLRHIFHRSLHFGLCFTTCRSREHEQPLCGRYNFLKSVILSVELSNDVFLANSDIQNKILTSVDQLQYAVSFGIVWNDWCCHA